MDPQHHHSLRRFVTNLFITCTAEYPSVFVQESRQLYRQLSGASSRSTCEYTRHLSLYLGWENSILAEGSGRHFIKQGHFDQRVCDFECFGPSEPVDCINNERKSRSIHPDLSHRREIQRQGVSNEFYIDYDGFIIYTGSKYVTSTKHLRRLELALNRAESTKKSQNCLSIQFMTTYP